MGLTGGLDPFTIWRRRLPVCCDSSSDLSMKIVFVGLGTALLLGLSGSVAAQTPCGIQHPGPGVFICYPNPSESTAGVPALFHISAQVNAPSGATTRRYSIFLDNQLLYDNRLATSAERLPIELNLVSPFHSGSHTLRLTATDIGSAEIKNLQFRTFEDAGFCEPLSKVETFSSCYSSIKVPLHWTVEKRSDEPRPSPLSPYAGYVALYSRNLKSIEADVADQVAVDSQGNLYLALHLFGGLELRKYTPNRSIVYDAVVQTCGPGALFISGLAVDDANHVWIAGNTRACLTGTNGAWKPRISDTSQPHAFVALLDTSKPTSTTPLYLTYLAEVENQVFGIRVDKDGNAYVTGATSPEFPHQSTFPLSARPSATKETGFVAVLNPGGSALEWTTLLQNVSPAALALDGAGNVYVTGRTGADAFLAELTEHGTKLAYTARLGPGNPFAIAVAPAGGWALVEEESQLFAPVLEPCAKGKIFRESLPQGENSVGAEVSSQLALDAFARVFAPPSCHIAQ